MSVDPASLSFVFLDTETSGLPGDPNARVTELGLVRVSEGRIVAELSAFVRPEVLDADGLEICERISGTSLADLEAAMTVDQARSLLCLFCGSLEVYAYNRAFDEVMVARTFFGGDEAETGLRWGPCTMRTFSKTFAIYGSGSVEREAVFSLWKALALTGLTFEGDPHRALTDARAGAKLQLGLSAGLFVPTASLDDMKAVTLTTRPSAPIEVRPRITVRTSRLTLHGV